MPHLTRRGFTLTELLIALILLGIVTAAFYRSLATNQRVYQKQTQVIDLQQNLRAAVAVLPQELQQVDAADGDIIAMASDSITFLARRWMGFLCEAPKTGPVLIPSLMTIRNDPFFGRPPQAGDVILVRYEGDDGTRKDDDWIPVTPISTTPKNCPDGKAGQLVTMNMTLGPLQDFPNAMYAGSPVLGYEKVTYSLYQPAAGGDWYIGLTTATGKQRLVGPVLPGGLALAYFDSSGVATATPTQVARVDVVVRGLTNQPVRASAGTATLARVVDSVRTSVSLRNNRRF